MKQKHDRTNILEIGSQLFRKQGYHNTGTEEILEKANYPRSSFYYHFKSKEGFGVATLHHYGQNIKGKLDSILNSPEVESPTARLKQYFFMIAGYAEQTANSSTCLVQRFAIEASAFTGPLQQAAQEEFVGWVAVAEATVREGQHLGEIRTDVGAADVSELLFSMIYGGSTVGRLSHDPKELERKMTLAFQLIRP